MDKAKFESLHVEMGKGRQSWEYTEEGKLFRRAVRIKIKIDSYDFQSKCVMEFLTPNGWQELAQIGYYDMTAIKESVNGHAKEDDARNVIMADRNRLISRAKAILPALD